MYKKLTIGYRAIGLMMLYILWIRSGYSTDDLIFVLVLVALALLRWRLPNFKYTLILDQYIITVAASSWEYNQYALAFTAFEAALLGKILLIMPAIIYTVVHVSDIVLQVVIAQSLFVGFILYAWQNQYKTSLMQIDGERSRYYKTENINQELLTANAQIAQMTEISERSRIAAEIHDNAGHEIVAAYISLQTVQSLIKDTNADVNELFDESMTRLESGIDKIREVVHNIAPITEIGIFTLEKLCKQFDQCPMQFKVYGDSAKVSVHLWMILETCLKEALTNIIRHAEATNVKVLLDITPYIVRLYIENDGVSKSNTPAGLGIYNLRSRARAVGGNISTDFSDYFKLVCVLPIKKDKV